MEIQKKITVLSENLNNLRSALEDFRDHHISKKEKIKNLENEIKNLRKQMSEYIDESVSYTHLTLPTNREV